MLNVFFRIKTIGAKSKEIANSTRDQRFRTEVLNYSDAALNYSVQLKILSGVKAASGPNDETAENQLITCAQELVNALIHAIKSGEAALLKPK